MFSSQLLVAPFLVILLQIVHFYNAFLLFIFWLSPIYMFGPVSNTVQLELLNLINCHGSSGGTMPMIATSGPEHILVRLI